MGPYRTAYCNNLDEANRALERCRGRNKWLERVTGILVWIVLGLVIVSYFRMSQIQRHTKIWRFQQEAHETKLQREQYKTMWYSKRYLKCLEGQ